MDKKSNAGSKRNQGSVTTTKSRRSTLARMATFAQPRLTTQGSLNLDIIATKDKEESSGSSAERSPVKPDINQQAASRQAMGKTFGSNNPTVPIPEYGEQQEQEETFKTDSSVARSGGPRESANAIYSDAK